MTYDRGSQRLVITFLPTLCCGMCNLPLQSLAYPGRPKHSIFKPTLINYFLAFVAKYLFLHTQAIVYGAPFAMWAIVLLITSVFKSIWKKNCTVSKPTSCMAPQTQSKYLLIIRLKKVSGSTVSKVGKHNNRKHHLFFHKDNHNTCVSSILYFASTYQNVIKLIQKTTGESYLYVRVFFRHWSPVITLPVISV